MFGVSWLVLGLAGTLGCGSGSGSADPSARRAAALQARQEARAEARARPPRAARGLSREGRATEAGSAWSGPKTVLLLVQDTVRADHMSLCGYERPTTPHIERLASKGAVYTCSAYSPATWTLPSHASFFTGLHTTSHDVLRKGSTLSTEHETLAEHFAGLGFQTGLISANPTVNRASGMWQGFEEVRVAKGLYSAWRGRDLVAQVRDVLKGFDNAEPLFLVVNIFDAHDPYPAVPAGVDWVSQQPGLDVNPSANGPQSAVHRFVRGELPPVERSKFLERVVDTYDWGIAEADANLGRLVALLQQGGWLDEGVRVVVTSDHGEHLGEHNLIRHDGAPWEGVVRVPFLFYDSTQETLPPLPEPMSATWAYHLLRDGALSEPSEVASAALAYDKGEGHSRHNSVALWPGQHRKLMWIEGEQMAFDPVADPLEERAVPLEAAEVPLLLEHVEALSSSRERALGEGVDPDMMKMLEAVGYVE